MLAQEDEKSPAFRQERFEDAVVPDMSWRLKACVTGVQDIYGGILADKPGFGKTVLSLALIWFTRAQALQYGKSIQAGRVVIKATLIIVPTAIIGQWEEESGRYLGDKLRIKAVKTLVALDKLLPDIANVDILIVPRTLFDHFEDYETVMARESGMLERTAGGLRAMQSWTGAAIKGIEQRVNPKGVFGKSPSTTPQQDSSDYHETVCEKETEKFEFGTVCQANARAEKQKKIGTKSALSSLHRFSFYRIVEDEVTYKSPEASILISSLKARCYWALSGTLPMTSFNDISESSSLLGIDLGTHNGDEDFTHKGRGRVFQDERTSQYMVTSWFQTLTS